MIPKSVIGLLLGTLGTTPLAAQTPGRTTLDLTYEKALQMARERAPELELARARAREIHRREAAASVWRFNPELSGSVGARWQGGEVSIDASAGLHQWLEMGGQRGDRVAVARARSAAQFVRGEDIQRLVLREVALAFIETVYWGQRVALSEKNRSIAADIASIATKRHEVGDVGGLEQSVTALSHLRAKIEVERAKTSLIHAKGRMKLLLGLEASVRFRCLGNLTSLGLPVTEPFSPTERPDIRVLQAELRQAEAEVELGRAHRVPNIALGAEFAQEESQQILMGSLTIELPFFNHGQGTTGIAQARRERLRSELQATRKKVSGEISAAQAAVQKLQAAVRDFTQVGLVTLQRSQQIATASYETGAIPLGELLSVRRELLQAELEYLDLLRNAAIARTELDANTGALK